MIYYGNLEKVPIWENIYGLSVDIESATEKLAVVLEWPGVMDELREEDSLSPILLSLVLLSLTVVPRAPKDTDSQNLLTVKVPCHGSESSFCGF